MIATETGNGRRGPRSFGCGEEARCGGVHPIDVAVAVNALIGVFNDETFVTAMFGVAAEAGLLLFHGGGVELAALMTFRATLIHERRSLAFRPDKFGKVERVWIGACGCFDPVAQAIAGFVVTCAAIFYSSAIFCCLDTFRPQVRGGEGPRIGEVVTDVSVEKKEQRRDS